MSAWPPMRAESVRLLKARGTWLLLPLPAIVGVLRICGRLVGERIDAAERVATRGGLAVVEEELNGFGPLADGLRTGGAMVTLLILILGALAIVRDRETGALSQLFLYRRRGTIVVAKAICVLGFGVAAFALLLAACAAVSAGAYGLGDVVEEGFVMASAAELWREVAVGSLATLPAFFAVAAFAVLVSSGTTGAGAAVAFAIVPIVLFDVLAGLLSDVAPHVFLTYAPFLGNGSPLAHLTDIARAYSEAEWQDGELSRAAGIPALQGIVLLFSAMVVTARRSA